MYGKKMRGKAKNKLMTVLVFIAMLLQCLPLTALAYLDGDSQTLVGGWHFDEGEGTIAADSSGNSNNGTIDGATWIYGKLGAALKFDGNAYVEIPYNCILNPRKAITVEAWVNPASNTVWQRIVAKSAYPNTDYSLFSGANNNIGFSIKIGNVVRTAYAPKNSVPVGAWTYVVGTYDGKRLRIYINGKQVNSFAVSGQINAHADALRIGGDPRGDYFKGVIDEVHIYNQALTAQEILCRYQSTKNKAQSAIAGGGFYSLLLKEDGRVWTWGSNTYHYTTEGDSVDAELLPVQKVEGPEDVKTIAAGLFHRLVLKGDGTVWVWGSNEYGLLGDGTTKESSTEPVQVKGLADVIAIAAGHEHNLVLKGDGTVWAWGSNWQGQLGDGTTTHSTEPVQVKGLTGVIAIDTGYYHSLAVKSDGTVWAWGDNYLSQLGDGTTTHSTEPVQVKGLTDVVEIATEGCFSLAVKSNGTVWAWGYNGQGQLGDGTTKESSTEPVQVKGLTNVVGITAGHDHSLAVKSNGTVWAWGYNRQGQLGDGTTINRNEPVQIPGLAEVAAIAAGEYHSLALKGDGSVWGWGYNEYAQLGDKTYIKVYTLKPTNL